MAGTLQQQINLKREGSHSYTTSWHPDWTIGFALHGGHVAAALHYAAATHLSTTLAARDQPDILTFHVEFLRPGELSESAITITDLKLGASTSTLQLQLSQNGQDKAVALATSINFETFAGHSAPTAWCFHPAPPPVPDFKKVRANKPEANWLPNHLSGEVLPMTGRQLVLDPRIGFPVDGLFDTWYSFMNGERMDATYMVLMGDCIPSMSDTLLRNGGLYDARKLFSLVEKSAEANPGVTAELKNSFKEAMKSTIFNNTVTLDLEFKRRLPKEGLEWVFSRSFTRKFEDGRLDLDITLCNENMEVVCLARQVILVLDAKRKFGGGKSKPAL